MHGPVEKVLEAVKAGVNKKDLFWSIITNSPQQLNDRVAILKHSSYMPSLTNYNYYMFGKMGIDA